MGRAGTGADHRRHRRRRRKKKLEPKGIEELLGIALGCIGLSYDDFCKLDFNDFAAIWKAYAEQRDTDFKDRWNRMRILAAITIQPHLSKKHRITPKKLLPFPWDKTAAKKRQDAPKMTAAEQRKRMAELVKKLGDEMI